MCFIHSMTSKTNTHGPGENHMSTGFTVEGFPSAGAWVSYALGSECDNLPAFVAIPDPRGVPQAGPSNWSSGFLPAVFQGTAFNADQPIANLAAPPEITTAAERSTRDFLQAAQRQAPGPHPGDSELAARIASYELAAKLQLSAPEVSDLSRETRGHARESTAPTTRTRYKAGFARNCLLARRLLERGVRFVQLFNGAYAMGEGVGNWDGHKTLKTQYDVHGPILDQPAAALLKDLKARGMLDDTLVVWTTEFGRMPTFQAGANGRDHNPKGFTVWLAGAGVKRAHQLRRHRRIRLQGRRKPVERVRAARHDPAPAGSRSPAAKLLPQRQRAAADVRARKGDTGGAGVNATEFKKVLGSCLLENEFTNEGGAYFKRSDDVVCVVGFQKASFEDSYFVNIGYVIRDLHPDVTAPRYADGDIRARFSFLAAGKQVDLFDPHALPSEDELRKIVRENVATLIEGAMSVPGLKALLARRPTMLYQATLKAKRALGVREN